jgi:hypothetical protein
MDPYGTAGTTPGTLYPQDPYFSSEFISAPMTAMTKFRQDIKFDYHWFVGHGDRELGINELDFSATFAIPFLRNPNTPLLITPGFGMQLWEGPVSVLSTPIPDDPSAADLPSKTYGAYIDTAWKPMVSQTISGDLSARIGLYSDFTTTTTKSIRLTGAAYGVLSYSPSFQIKAGLMYINRLQIKLLPAGGIIWKPSEDFECQILFPNPKIRKKWANFGSVEWWVYGAADYGGGSWTIKRANIPGISDSEVAGQNDAFDYDDIRVSAGLEFFSASHLNGWFEAGGAFSRKLHYRSGLPSDYFPNNTFFLRAGLSY